MFEEYTDQTIDDKKPPLEIYNWKSAKPFKEYELLLRIGEKKVYFK
jgi:hypothetical protein